MKVFPLNIFPTAVSVFLVLVFSTADAKTISGTVDYRGTKKGRIYISARSVPSGWTYGASIAKPGAFEIRGLDESEEYEVTAHLASHGNRSRYASDPASPTAFIPESPVDTFSVKLELVDQTGVLCDPPAFDLWPQEEGMLVRLRESLCGNAGRPEAVMITWHQTTPGMTSATTAKTSLPTGAQEIAGKTYVPVIDSPMALTLIKIPNNTTISIKTAAISDGQEGPPSPEKVMLVTGKTGPTITGTVSAPKSTVGKTAYLFLNTPFQDLAATSVRIVSTTSPFKIVGGNDSWYSITGFIDINGNRVWDNSEPQLYLWNDNNLPGTTQGLNVLTYPTAHNKPKPDISVQTTGWRYGNEKERYGLNFYVFGNTDDVAQATVIDGPDVIEPIDVMPLDKSDPTPRGNLWWLQKAQQSFGAHLPVKAPKKDDQYTVRLTSHNGRTTDRMVTITAGGMAPTPIEPVGQVPYTTNQIFRWTNSVNRTSEIDWWVTGIAIPDEEYTTSILREGDEYTFRSYLYSPEPKDREEWSVITADIFNNFFVMVTPFYFGLGTMEGTVTDESAAPEADVLVELKDLAARRYVASTRTNSLGKFSIDSLPPGEYLVCFESESHPRQCPTKYAPAGILADEVTRKDFRVVRYGSPPPHAPSGTVSINDGASGSGARTVNISVSTYNPDASQIYCRNRWDDHAWSLWETCLTSTESYIPDSRYSATIDGPHTFYMQFRNGAGKVSPVTASATVYLDTTPPAATIESGPHKVSKESNPAFRIGGNDVVTYVAAVDGEDYSVETDVKIPFRLTNLPYGEHVLRVRGRDAVGNWQTAATEFRWHTDTAIAVVTPSISVRTYTVGGAGVIAYRYKLPGKNFSRAIPASSPLIIPASVKGVVAVQGRSSSGTWQKGATTISIN